MPDHFNGLSPAEAERLALLAEECGEVIQVIGKILRHGYRSSHPNGGPDNRRLLEKELGDLDVAIAMLINAHDVDSQEVDDAKVDKMVLVQSFLHHQ